MYTRLDIQKRLTLVLWGVVSIAFVVFGGALVVVQRLSLESRVRETMRPWVELITVGADAAIAFEDPVRAQEILETLRANTSVLEVELVLEGGRSLARYHRAGAAAVAPATERPAGLHLEAETAEWVEVLPSGARLHLVMALSPLEETTRLLSFFGVGVLVLLFVTLGQQAVLRRMLVAPIARLTRSTELVRARADYHHRVSVVGTDEVARLAESFNAMLAAIEQREAELHALGALHRTVLDHLASGVVSTDTRGLVTSMNPAAERITGYSAAEVVGVATPLQWHDAQEVDARAVAPTPFEAIIKASREGTVEWACVSKGGERVPVEVAISPLLQDGQLVGYVGLMSDLRRRKEFERGLAQLNAQLEELNAQLERRVAERTAALEAANAELEAFAYSVSHDLRAPLRHIDGFLELLRKRLAGALDGESAHLFGRVAASSARMSQLIDDLLGFSHMSRKELSQSDVSLAVLVQEVIGSLEAETAGRRVEWKVGPLPDVWGDRAMLRTVFENLLGNALKFTRPREVAVIEVRAEVGADEVTVCVADNGVGFDPRYADKLFGVFRRLHTAEQFEGTGIGLANVRRVITRHGGRTWATSVEGAGASLFFTLSRRQK